jgi:hypothetical protein
LKRSPCSFLDRKSSKGFYKRTKIVFKGATPEEVEACELMFQHHFTRVMATEEPPLLAPTAEITTINEIGLDDDGDLGVAEFKHSSLDQLCSLLQMPDGRPPVFNATLATNRLRTPWDCPNHKFPEDERTENCALLWHQIGGVAALAKRAWLKKQLPSTLQTPGTMLADGVGVGKTLQMLTFIGMTMCVYAAEQQKGAPRPPLIGKPQEFPSCTNLSC